MMVNTENRILSGSWFYRICCSTARESVSVKVLLGLWSGLTATIMGSRMILLIRRKAVPLFLVNDHLDQRFIFKYTLLENSRCWLRLKATVDILFKALNWKSRANFSGGIAGKALSTGQHGDRYRLKQQAMAMAVLYMLFYYPFRQLLLLLSPDGKIYNTWASGICLALILATIYLLLTKSSDSDDH